MRRIVFALVIFTAFLSSSALLSSRAEALPANPGIAAAAHEGAIVDQARWGWGGHWGHWGGGHWGHWGGWHARWWGWRPYWRPYWGYCRHWWNGRWHPWCL